MMNYLFRYNTVNDCIFSTNLGLKIIEKSMQFFNISEILKCSFYYLSRFTICCYLKFFKFIEHDCK